MISRARARRIATRLRSALAPPEVSQRRIARFLSDLPGPPATMPGGPVPGTVAIVVPCYGHAAHLPTMVAGIVAQTRRPDEVIFVVDGSPDDSAAILVALVDLYADRLPSVCMVLTNETNDGQAASLNRAIRVATTDRILVLNDDDLLMDDTVEVMDRLFSRHPEVALIGGHSIHFRDDIDLASQPSTIASFCDPDGPALEVRPPSTVRAYRSYNDLNMTHTGSCFRKLAWKAVGGYWTLPTARLVPFSDRDFQLRVSSLYPVGLSTEVPLSYWRSGSSVDGGRNS